MQTFAPYHCLLLLLTLFVPLTALGETQSGSCASWLNHEVKQLHSKNMINLCDQTKGKPVLIVNTASHCGYTKQFSGLEKLHNSYKDNGLVIVGFPSNTFNQEASKEAETASVCYKNYGVTFLMTKTVSVRGPDAHPVFQHLAAQSSSPNWNFNKYLIDARGNVVRKFNSSMEPNDERLTGEIDKVLYSF